ncbi:uncharacterized protein M421DRAFT_397029 [Didymella exigua CBS 183.55]|uniref:Uncharacterized protein n=1 Tax=Didymella exigua CBS 183.55 TaxID=1150837 RepID=A0A6A5RD89_9PLEO|nr:uncharacterized protein M421DRAFT_397029 [Didymella exigua CBS 183.55]KAF1926225.1 hypothetical protein M421DRAFT_397029 [Didymella exigua CBS 183.55]
MLCWPWASTGTHVAYSRNYTPAWSLKLRVAAEYARVRSSSSIEGQPIRCLMLFGSAVHVWLQIWWNESSATEEYDILVDRQYVTNATSEMVTWPKRQFRLGFRIQSDVRIESVRTFEVRRSRWPSYSGPQRDRTRDLIDPLLFGNMAGMSRSRNRERRRARSSRGAETHQRFRLIFS